MKIFKLFIVVLASAAFFAVSIAAQTENKPDVSRLIIASVDTKAFKDEKSGIKELVIAYDQLKMEVKPQLDEMNVLAAKLQEIKTKYFGSKANIEIERGKDIQMLTQEVKAKFEEYQKLMLEFKAKDENYKTLCENHYAELVKPVNNKIGKALEKFKTEKGYAFILDITSLSCDCILDDKTPDVTTEFIKFYNDTFSTEKAQ